MRRSLRRSAVVGAAVATLLGLSPPAEAQSSDAIGRMISEELAREAARGQPAGATRIVIPAERPTPADEQRLLEEIEMLERARAEAEARRDELVKAREAAERDEGKGVEAAAKAQEARRQAEEAQRAVEAARKAEDERRIAEAQRRAEESRRAAEAARKAEDERRIAEQQRQADEARRQAEAARQAEDERRVAEERQKAEEAEVAQMESEREAEADRIDEALRKAREARARRSGLEREPYRPDEPAAERRRIEASDVSEAPGAHDDRRLYRPGTSEPGARPSHTSSPRVTVLLTMSPGNRGIRRHNKTGDPILCGERGCYISAGADVAADLLPLRRAFGAGRTLGERAGACRNSLGCVFRDVDLVAFPAIVQPVDMRFLRHDRRQPQVLHETSACRLTADRLACSPIQGPDYTMWVVPEEIAQAAGPALLERAVEDGLPGADAPVLRSVRN